MGGGGAGGPGRSAPVVAPAKGVAPVPLVLAKPAATGWAVVCCAGAGAGADAVAVAAANGPGGVGGAGNCCPG